jgi:hypothetical protein
MLYDQFAQFPESPSFASMMPEMRHAYRDFSAVITKSPRFVLDRAAAMMVQNVSVSSPYSLVTALNICRLPFKSMWVEFDYAYRAEWCAILEKRGHPVAVHEMASNPSRLGFLLEAEDDDGRIIIISPMWSHPSDDISLHYSHLSLRIDMRPDFVPNEADVARGIEALDVSRGRSVWERNDRDTQGMSLLSQRTDTTIPDRLGPIWAKIAGTAMEAKLIEISRFDLRAEWSFVLALLVVLNSRNIVNFSDEIAVPKLNKARIKKGKPPLLSRREIVLNLSKVQQRRMGSTGGGRSFDPHLVMGHIKIRKTGAFWWNSHVRGGTIDDIEPKIYHVRG